MSKNTYDSAYLSDAEIVAPGIDKDGKDLALRALKAGFKDAETKQVILKVLGDKAEVKPSQARDTLRVVALFLSERRKYAQDSARFKGADNATSKGINDIDAAYMNKQAADFWKSI